MHIGILMEGLRGINTSAHTMYSLNVDFNSISLIGGGGRRQNINHKLMILLGTKTWLLLHCVNLATYVLCKVYHG